MSTPAKIKMANFSQYILFYLAMSVSSAGGSGISAAAITTIQAADVTVDLLNM
jgi:hypothetical protein